MKRRFDAILVLGINLDKRAFKFRVDKAISLYKKKIAPKIIFSGQHWGGLRKIPVRTEAAAMSAYAKLKGVPVKDMFREELSRNTIGNFYFTRKYILEPHRFKNILVITHKNHFPRSKYFAQKVLGPNYKVQFKEDNPIVSKMIKEHSVLSDVKRMFPGLENVKNGDMKAINKILRNTSFYKNYPRKLIP